MTWLKRETQQAAEAQFKRSPQRKKSNGKCILKDLKRRTKPDLSGSLGLEVRRLPSSMVSVVVCTSNQPTQIH